MKAIRSDGVYVNYESSDWGVISLSGIEFAENEIFTEYKGIGNGEIVTGKRKRGRNIEVAAKLRDPRNDERFALMRKNILVFHNSAFTYDLEITVLGKKRIAKDCEIVASSYPTVLDSEMYPTLTVAYKSPYAVLFEDFTDTEQMFAITPMWHSDRTYAVESYPRLYGIEERITEKYIYYNGSEPAPLIITITASGLITEDIEIDLNGNIFKVTADLGTGDVLVINAETCDVYKNDTLLSPAYYNSEMFLSVALAIGDNVLKINSGDNLAFNSEISYTGRYDGV